MRFYAECVRRQLYLNGTNKIHLSKNPMFSGRVESLIEAFPDARIVVLMRNPVRHDPEPAQAHAARWKHAQVGRRPDEPLAARLAEQSFHTYRYPLEVLARHPDVKQAIVDYRDLVAAAPARRARRSTSSSASPSRPHSTRVLQREEQRARAHETTHTLQPRGVRPEGRRDPHGAGRPLRRYRWDDDAARPATVATGGSHGGER